MVNSARKAGDFRVLFPHGMDRIEDVPWFLQDAINHALGILAWHENYLSDELPHENLWDDSQAVEEHFERLRQRKEAEREGYGRDEDGESEMTSNDLASVFNRK